MEITLNKIFLIILMQQTFNFCKKNSDFIRLDLVYCFSFESPLIISKIFTKVKDSKVEKLCLVYP